METAFQVKHSLVLVSFLGFLSIHPRKFMAPAAYRELGCLKIRYLVLTLYIAPYPHEAELPKLPSFP